MRFKDWEYFQRFPASQPRAVEGGIKAATQRGNFGESWWARRWLAVLESFDIGSRLQRGRSYARKGQVLSIDVKKGMVEAEVQGSRAEPYQVTIEVRPLLDSEWKLMAEQLASEAIFAAKLLAGEMPRDIERAFTGAGLSLFPEKVTEISTDCSCPDWSNPCKHVAAVYYLLGEAFDRDPFLIFRMRGMEREEFSAMLGESGVTAEDAPPAPEPEPLPSAPEEFWSAKAAPADLLGDVNLTRAAAALPKRLGNLQFWRGEAPLPTALESTYEAAARRAGEILMGEKS